MYRPDLTSKPVSIRVSEEHYRNYYLVSDTNQVAIGVTVWLFAYLGFALNDYLILGSNPLFYRLAALRLAYVLFSIWMTHTLLHRAHPYQVFDRLTLLWGLITIAVNMTIGLSLPWGNVSNLLIDLVGIISFYIFIPGRTSIRVIPPLVYSLYDIVVTGFFYPEVSPALMSSLMFCLTTANMIGIIFSTRYFKMRRKEYHSYLEEEKTRQELQRLATTDPLTGVLNRRRLLELAGEAFYRFRRYGRPFSILLMDLDGFKRVNDTYGHQQGDATLIQFAQVVQMEKREADSLGRMGGDEFCLVLPETSGEAAAMFAERIIRSCARIDVNRGAALDVLVSVSIGITEVHPDDTSLDTTFARGDAALYRAKDLGRNRWAII